MLRPSSTPPCVRVTRDNVALGCAPQGFHDIRHVGAHGQDEDPGVRTRSADDSGIREVSSGLPRRTRSQIPPQRGIASIEPGDPSARTLQPPLKVLIPMISRRVVAGLVGRADKTRSYDGGEFDPTG